MGCGNSRHQPPVQDTKEIASDTGLSERQRQIIKDSWKLVKVNMLFVGLDIFSIFFKREDREALSHFPKIINYREDGETPTIHEGNLQYHVMLVMKGIGKVVDNLDHPLQLVNFLNYVGFRHMQQNVEPDMLERLWPAIDEGFSSALSDVYTEELRTSWKILIDFMVKRIQNSMEENSQNTLNGKQTVTNQSDKIETESKNGSDRIVNGSLRNGTTKH